MNCPKDAFGRPPCYIVPHPDRPEQESFCVSCQERFRRETATVNDSIIALIVTAILVILIVL